MMPTIIKKMNNFPIVPQEKSGRFFGLLTAAALLLLVVSAGTAFFFYEKFQEVKRDPQRVAQEEVRTLIRRVGELIVLPEGEEPTVATVTDPERLRDQAFFAKAKKGDKVLIYTNAKRAILYDPAGHKIVEVAPVSIGASPAADQQTSAAAKE